ncbi:hypothetical protein Esti_003188 [Eimeria stiedai]
MEGPALADAHPTKAGAPNLRSTWQWEDLEPQTAADTSAVEAFPEEEVAKEVCDAPAEATREASNPFVRILQKVGAPPALLKSQSQAGERPTQEGPNGTQMQPPFPAAASQEMPAEYRTTETTALHTQSKLASSSRNEAQGSRESSADTTVAVAEAEAARSNSDDTPEYIYALQLEEPTKPVETGVTSNGEHHNAAFRLSEEDGPGEALSAVALPTQSPEKASDTPPAPSRCESPPEAAQASGKQEEVSADSSVSSPSVDAPQWPFESGLRPWEDVGKETRKAAEGISNHQLEDHKKTRIWVIHRGVCTPVSWYVDTSAEDVKTSILCACDVLADEEQLEDQGEGGGFCLRQIRPLPDSAEVDCDELFMGVKTLTLRCALPPNEAREGLLLQVTEQEQPRETTAGEPEEAEEEVSVRVVLGHRVFSKDFPFLKDGATYLLEPRISGDDDSQQREELASLRKMTGDKWRRLSVAVDPFAAHHGSHFLFCFVLAVGANLLKHTRFGHPHLRQFQLSADRQRLIWYSASKGKEASVVHMSELQGLVIGQKSANFTGYRIPALQHLSFSLVFRGEDNPAAFSIELPDICLENARTLDLTCKDEFEFDSWVTGCKAVIAANKGLKLSKMNLLSHSRRFLKAVQRSDTTVQLTKLPEVKERAGLQDCMDLPWHPPEELERKYEEQRKRVVAVAEEMRSLDKKTVVRSSVDISVLVGAGPAYANILGDSAEVDDEEMEFERMHELLKEVIDVLNKAKAKLTEYRAAESARRKCEEEAAASAQAVWSSSSPGNPEEAAEAPAGHRASEESGELPALLDGTGSSAILAISSRGQVLMKSGAPGLTFDERFKMASSNTASAIDLEAVQEQMKEGLSALLQRAASQTAEAQQLFSSALAAAAAAVGVDTELQALPPQTLPPEDIEKLKAINQLLWRAEVDVENIEDMLERLQAPSGFGGFALAGTVANLNQMVTEQVNKWGGQLASIVTGFLQRADVPRLVQGTGPQAEPRRAFTDSEYEDDFM